MSDLPRDPILDDGDGDPAELDQPEDLETELEDEPQEGDEPDAADGEDEAADEPPRQTRRTGPRGRPNGEEIRELRRENEDIRRQMQALQQPRQPAFDPAAQARADQEFWASLDLMTPAEAHRAVYTRATREVSQAFFQQNTQTQETLDKQAYDAQARNSRVHQQYRSRVEELVSGERARGNIVNRDVALRYLLGEDAINRANKVAPAQRRQGAARVNSQTVRPGNGRGDVARGGARRNQDTDDEALLRGTRVADI